MHLRPIEDNRINSRTFSESIHLSSHWHQPEVAFLFCHPVLSVFLSATFATPKYHKDKPWKHTNTMFKQTRSLHMPMNPNATFVSTQCVLHKERKQESLLSEAAQRKHRVTASQNKCQRSPLYCWCLHRLLGNRTIQVHSGCFQRGCSSCGIISVACLRPKHLNPKAHITAAWKQRKHYGPTNKVSQHINKLWKNQVFPTFVSTCSD